MEGQTNDGFGTYSVAGLASSSKAAPRRATWLIGKVLSGVFAALLTEPASELLQRAPVHRLQASALPDSPIHELPTFRPLHGSQSRCTDCLSRYSVPSPRSEPVHQVPGHSPQSLASPWFRCPAPPGTARARLPLRNVVQRRTARQLMTTASNPDTRRVISPGINRMGLPVEGT
jgi:hypothetical protein